MNDVSHNRSDPAADVIALREALPPITHVFSGYPFDAPSSSRPSITGDLLYRAILRNPAEVFRAFCQRIRIAERDPEEGKRSELFRQDVALLLLRWKALPIYRHCASYTTCGNRAEYAIAAGIPRENDWRDLRFPPGVRSVCHQHGCQARAAKFARLKRPWTVVPLDVDTLMEYVGQEFGPCAKEFRTLEGWRMSLYPDQERYGDLLVRAYDIQGLPYTASEKDLWRARKFFGIDAPYVRTPA